MTGRAVTLALLRPVLALVLVFGAAPLRAAGPAPEAVLAAFEGLLGEPRNRTFFGLPEDRAWRPAGRIAITLYAEEPDALAGALRDAAAAFSAATGSAIDLASTRPLADLDRDQAFGLRIAVGPRPLMAKRAADLGIHPGMIRRFAEVRWPFAFTLPRGADLIGRVLIAEEETPAVVEATLIMALVWALGGVTLGGELEDLIDPTTGAPALTPLGAAVFALMYHPGMKAGLPLAEARARARRILGLAQ